MRLPAPSAHFSQRVRYGRYVARRLRRARMTTLAADAEKATLAVLTLGRAYEDADGPIQDAIADRDASDDDLDGVAQTARLQLASRSTDAATTAPYTLVFHEGIGYYTAAPLDEEVKRYGELKQRLVEHLPANDKVRQKAVPAIDAGLDSFTTAAGALDAARTEEALAATRLAAAIEAWDRQMEKTYGALVADRGRSAAEQFFPKPKGKKVQASPVGGGGENEPS